MAILDPRTDTVVIRVVYDGAPMAGKSTSVRALGRGLGGEVISPAEIAGRILYFDWLDYTGGLFEGRRIRCQIVSVPGQATLAPRRRRLLESADAIIFVGDSTPAGFAADRNYLGSLGSVLAGMSGPDEAVASGMVWPPVDGRLVLHELTRAGVALQCLENGDWAGTAAGKWRLHSGVDAVFPEIEQGRAVLVQSARVQAAQARESSDTCCIALAADGHGQFRLWRIARIA